MSDSKRLVAIAPEKLFDDGNGSLINLRHPRYDDGALFYHDNDSAALWEVQRYKEKYRSWFIGNSVKSDGSLYFITPFDPLFIAIPYLRMKTRFSTVETVLEDSEYPEVKQIIDSKQLTERLHLISDVKSSAGFKVVLFSESKTLRWLESKFLKVEGALKTSSVSCYSEGASQASCWRSAEASDPEAIRQYALGVLMEYLPDDLTNKLAERLQVKIPESDSKPAQKPNGIEKKTENATTENGTGENLENGPPKKRRSTAVTTDYQQTFKLLVDKKETTEKAKLKKQPGMQSITNFFKKS